MASVITVVQPALADYKWVNARNGYVPPGAIQGGFDGEKLYVCSIGSAVGKLAPGHRKCYVAYGNQAFGYDRYQVLVADNWKWVPVTGDVPQGAVIGGEDGEALYVCNAVVAGKWAPGKYPVSHDVCYVAYGNKSIGVKSFNVLISR
ncbi:DUF3421 domain-containing protein [Nostoc sp. CALU 546]|uniref:DUF3421 domain-containing protein n=1 Tax=Nostoc sp. CALU 546 TaxID=1867241 RepID=UPI003B66D96A